MTVPQEKKIRMQHRGRGKSEYSLQEGVNVGQPMNNGCQKA